MRALLFVLSSTPAWAVTSQQVEDACFEKLKPMMSKGAKVTAVRTSKPDPSRRNSAWHVHFDFTRVLLNGEKTASCMFHADGRPLGDDYTDHLAAKARMKEREAAEKAIQDSASNKATR